MRWLVAVLAFMLTGLVLGGEVGGAVVCAATARGPAMEVSVIQALRTDSGASMDPRLRDLPQLTRDQPFVRYNVFKLLETVLLPLESGKPVAHVLVNGRTLQVTLVDLRDDKGERRFHVRAEIGEPGKEAFLKLLEVTASGNDPFFVGGQSYQGGTLFLQLTVRP